MTLDATGEEPVRLVLGEARGPLSGVMALVDTIDLMGVPVHVDCLGRVEGAAVAVVAAGSWRAAAPHARFRLCEPGGSASGNADQLAAWAERHRCELDQFIARLARATGRHPEHVEADLSLGRWLGAQEAVAYGLVDEVWQTGAQRR
jgi:ATP-dependent Clp protease protease subunit